MTGFTRDAGFRLHIARKEIGTDGEHGGMANRAGRAAGGLDGQSKFLGDLAGTALGKPIRGAHMNIVKGPGARLILALAAAVASGGRAGIGAGVARSHDFGGRGDAKNRAGNEQQQRMDSAWHDHPKTRL